MRRMLALKTHTKMMMGMKMSDRYIVELHGSSCSKHKTWRIVRQYDRCIICVCVYKRGAYRVCDELNALASGKMGANQKGDQFI